MPRIALESAVELVRKLHGKAGKANIKPEVAAGAIGYSGLNGASLGALAALGYYGLTNKDRTGLLSVSPLALKLIHPVSPTQEHEARREAALLPKVFADLVEGGHHYCDESVLANQLIHQGFTSEGAKRTAGVFKNNVEFAKLTEERIIHEMIPADAPQSRGQLSPSQSAHDQGRMAAQMMGLESPFAPASPFASSVRPATVESQELPLLVDGNRIARIPFPMSNKSFDRFLKMLELYRDEIVREPEAFSQHSSTEGD